MALQHMTKDFQRNRITHSFNRLNDLPQKLSHKNSEL